jgi:hypothetical protein
MWYHPGVVDVEAWKRFVRGQRTAERKAGTLRTPVKAADAMARMESLRRLGQTTSRQRTQADGDENLAFHLKWAELRRRMAG